MMVENERYVDVKANVDKIRKDLVVIDGTLKSLDSNWSEDFSESRVIVAQLRKLFAEEIRLLDSVGSSIFYEERVNSLNFGYRENTLGGSRKNIAKSSNENDFIKKILNGEIGVKGITEATKPKNARTE
jgi:hypothetical protein